MTKIKSNQIKLNSEPIFEHFFLQLLKNSQKSKLFQGKFKFKLTIS